MATTVTISNNPATTVTLKPANKSFASVTTVPSANISLGQLSNVDVANIANGQALVYNSANGKYEGGSVSATVTELTGGRF